MFEKLKLWWNLRQLNKLREKFLKFFPNPNSEQKELFNKLENEIARLNFKKVIKTINTLL